MSYRKFSAQQLFTGREMLTGDYVLITNEEGIVDQIVSMTDAGEGVEKLNGILSPCFINCHCHLELSHLKGKIPEGTGMLRFISAVMTNRTAADAEMLAAVELAETEMLDNGIIATGDVCNGPVSLVQKTRGRMYYHNFIEIAGFDPRVATKRFDSAKELFGAFAGQYALPIESNSIVPHAPYSVSPELLENILNFPGNHVLSIHSQESIAEDEFLRNKKGDFLELYKNLGLDIAFFNAAGTSSLKKILPYFKRNQTLILVHNVTTDQSDLEFIDQVGDGIRRSDIYLCLCPNANQYIGNGLPSVEKLAESGLTLVLGTDSLASNHRLSILEEIKTLQKYFPALSLETMLKWGTINGARALQLDDMLGSFEKDKQPGVNLLSTDLQSVRRLI